MNPAAASPAAPATATSGPATPGAASTAGLSAAERLLPLLSRDAALSTAEWQAAAGRIAAVTPLLVVGTDSYYESDMVERLKVREAPLGQIYTSKCKVGSCTCCRTGPSEATDVLLTSGVLVHGKPSRQKASVWQIANQQHLHAYMTFELRVCAYAGGAG